MPPTLKAKITKTSEAANLQGELKKLTDDYNFQLAQAGVDVAGIFDPTPISDIVGGTMSLMSGDFVGAGLSAVSMIPYVGDAVGKSAKGARAAKRIAELQRKIKKTTEALTALEKQANNALLKKAVKPSAAKKANAAKKAAKNKACKTCSGAQPKSFAGKLRGQKVTLPNVTTKKINYIKRPRPEYIKLRNAFDTKERAAFVKKLSTDPQMASQLKKAGLTNKEISNMKNGLLPSKAWQVHHKIPIDDGGTNAFDNLVLIKNDPYHQAITNYQREALKGLEVGKSKQVDFPIPSGFVYPPKP